MIDYRNIFCLYEVIEAALHTTARAWFTFGTKFEKRMSMSSQRWIKMPRLKSIPADED